MKHPVLEFRAVCRHFSSPTGPITALADISFTLDAGETLALVGGSGSGKSTLARLAVGLVAPTSGEVRVTGDDLARLSPAGLRQKRQRIQMVFQDPTASLNPRLTVGMLVTEPRRIHPAATTPRWGRARRRWFRELAGEALQEVGLAPALQDAFPATLSGGQRQRVAIARALLLRPDVIIADEPVASLDRRAGLQILELLGRLQARHGCACLLISHDLAAVAPRAHRVMVLQAGRVVECGETRALLEKPQHPYTRRLLAAGGMWSAPPEGGA